MLAPADLGPDGERPQLDLRGLARLGMWGGSAACALLIVAVATQTATGQRRLATALQGGHAQAPSFPSDEERRRSLREVEIENRRLADQIRNLSQDRDRLMARITVLERNYEDMTGSTSRSANSPSAPARAATAEPNLAPHDRARAAAPAAQPAETAPARPEFGVDLGGAPSVSTLRTAWERIRRQHASELEGLRAVIGVRETRPGQADFRLLVGPIGDAAAAARLCASLTLAGLSCQPATFDGQKLALR